MIERIANYFLLVPLFCFALSFPAWAEDGVFPDKIILGQTAATEGPTAKLGIGMRDGMLAAFKEVNDRGGINGRKLELVSKNDSYEPEQALANAKTLINEDKVFALIGSVGTPTSKAVEPFISELKIPYIGPFSGAQLLRNPFKRYVVNVRASYFEETEKMAQYYVDDLHYKNIAILYQDDSFGRAGLDGIKKALSKRNMSLSAEATFVRNTVAVKQAVLTIGKVEPQVIVTIGTYAPIAEFVRVYRSLGLNAAFTTVSFVGTEALAEALGSQGKDFIVTEVTPHPYDDSIPIVKEYQKALKQYDEHLSFDYVSLEGYIVGRFAAQILEGMGDDITREKFLDAIYNAKDIRVAGLPMSFGPEDNQGLSVTYMSKIMGDGSFVSFNGQNK